MAVKNEKRELNKEKFKRVGLPIIMAVIAAAIVSVCIFLFVTDPYEAPDPKNSGTSQAVTDETGSNNGTDNEANHDDQGSDSFSNNTGTSANSGTSGGNTGNFGGEIVVNSGETVGDNIFNDGPTESTEGTENTKATDPTEPAQGETTAPTTGNGNFSVDDGKSDDFSGGVPF